MFRLNNIIRRSAKLYNRCLSTEINQQPTKSMNLLTAINDAMKIALAADKTTLVVGEDVEFGGVFRCTLGLKKEFPNQVLNTPLNEQSIIGFSIGYASNGGTVIAEIQFCDYIFPAFDQIVNEAAKYRYRSGGTYNCGGLTIRAPYGVVGHGGHYHSQSVEGYFAHTPGLKVVIPHNPIQAKGLLLSAIRTKDPILFFEPKSLYRKAIDNVPIGDYTIPLNKANIYKQGKDLTIISYGAQINVCNDAAIMANKNAGIDCEIVDLQTIVPWDRDTVFNSVKKTGRVLISHEAQCSFGVGAELAAEIQNNCFLSLQAPVMRCCGEDTPVPLTLEKFYIPNVRKVYDTILELAKY